MWDCTIFPFLFLKFTTTFLTELHGRCRNVFRIIKGVSAIYECQNIKKDQYSNKIIGDFVQSHDTSKGVNVTLIIMSASHEKILFIWETLLQTQMFLPVYNKI